MDSMEWYGEKMTFEYRVCDDGMWIVRPDSTCFFVNPRESMELMSAIRDAQFAWKERNPGKHLDDGWGGEAK